MDFKALQPYEGIIYFLTGILSLTFGAVILTLRRNAIILREKKWATPFAVTFFMLAGIYFLLLLDLWIAPPGAGPRPGVSYLIDAVINLSSGVTNFLLILSAYRLAEPVINKRRLLSFKNSKLGGVFTWPSLFFVLCSAGLLMSARPMWEWGYWVKAPDAVFSAIALSLMGYVLYKSISYRHDEGMAKLASLASFCYAVLYLFYGLTITQHMVSFYFPVEKEAESVAGMITSLVSLVLKFGIFFPAYSLMLLVSGPLEGVDRLLEPITRKNKEYLEGDGVAKSVRNELRVNSVKLYIKRPGPDDERVVLCDYPPSKPVPNGNSQEPREVKYEKGSHYDRVLKTGEPYIDSPPNRLLRKISRAAVAVRFHKSVIAVLYAERGDKDFTEADLINLKRIATMVSPAVQAYREMDALKQVGQELSQLQIGVKEYDMQRDVGDITKRIHDVISPVATGVSIEVGFAGYQGTYPPDEELEGLVKRRLAAERGGDDETDEEGNRWFTTGLKIPIVNANGEKDGDQVFGKFTFLSESEEVKRERVTVGTNPTFRRVLSDSLTETLLNFIRGRLNRLTDKLGSRLSGLKETNTESWRKVVEETAQEAKLLWVVVEDKENRLVGDEEQVKLVKRLESPERPERCEPKAENLWLYSLEEPQSETHHVIKKKLKDSRATLWFGVKRRGFGPELGYVSPWRYFLDHFCEIADSALRRIQMMKREEQQNSQMLLVLSTFDQAVDSKVVLHELREHAHSLTTSSETLLNVITNNGRQLAPNLRQAVKMFKSAQHMLEVEMTRIEDKARHNSSSSCSLTEVIADVSDELKTDLVNHNIRLHVEVPREDKEAIVHARYGITRSALKTILVNAKESLQYDSCTDKDIWITAGPAMAAGRRVCDIRDNGPGVSEDVKPTLLKAVSKSTKRNSHGVGLLLSRIALLVCGGDIIHLDQAGNGGATFRIEFPEEKSPDNGVEDEAERRAEVVHSGAQPARLLSF